MEANDINIKLLLKNKRTSDGYSCHYKARLIIFLNLLDAPFAHIFAPVVDFAIMRLVLAV